MKSDRKPSIYNDRTSIGSLNELDEYGVWVKSEPQDLSGASHGVSDTPDLDDMDLGIPDIEELPDLDELQAEVDGIADSGSISEDDFDLPDIDTGTDEESDGSVFDFGDFTNTADSISGSDIDSDSGGDTDSYTGIDEKAGFADDAVVVDDGIEEIFMDDFPETSAVEEEVSLKPSKPEPAPAASGTDLSTQLLMKIAEELASIRTELANLKKDFSGLKTAAAAEETGKEDYYSGSEDDKISLTGDELNNILNTANFTEEAGADATADLSTELHADLPHDTPALETDDETLNINDLDIDIDLDETALEEPENTAITDLEPEDEKASDELGTFEELDALDQSFEEVDLSLDDLDLSGDIAEDLSGEIAGDLADDTDLSGGLEELEELPEIVVDEGEELKTIMEEGVKPMTPAPDPDDAEYLADDPLADLPEDFLSETGEDTLDLSEAVIDEPDLYSDIQDNPPEEPSLDDISISLDLSELEGANDEEPVEELFEEPEEDMMLPAEEPGEDVTSLIPEGFVVEADDYQPSLDAAEDELIPEAEELHDDELELVEPAELPPNIKNELKSVLSYMDQLLDSLPDDKIEEFAKSEYYDTYKKLFKDLGIV